MSTVRIQVTRRNSSANWFQIGDIYDVEAETKPLKRYGGATVQAYFLIDNERNRKMHRRAVHSGMCIGVDCCRLLGGNNKDFKSLLKGE